jgi:hypothetical protein
LEISDNKWNVVTFLIFGVFMVMVMLVPVLSAKTPGQITKVSHLPILQILDGFPSTHQWNLIKIGVASHFNQRMASSLCT